jgi:hypothetical protein
MKNRLFIFGRFAHNSQRILAAVGQFALMRVERGYNFLVGFGLELQIAAFANTKQRRGFFYDSQTTLWHVLSLAHLERGVETLWKTNGTTTNTTTGCTFSGSRS